MEIVTALVSNTNVFTQVTAIGRRGSPGGGQNAACKRKIRNDPMSSLKSIISAPITINTASIALLMNGRSRESPSNVESEPRPRRLGTTNGRTFELDAVMPRAISMLHDNRHDRHSYQQDHDADQNFQRPPNFLFTLFAGHRGRHRVTHIRSRTSTSSTIGK